MDDTGTRTTGGCRCGALRYEAPGKPLRFSGWTRRFVAKSALGGAAVRKICAVCSSLVFDGPPG